MGIESLVYDDKCEENALTDCVFGAWVVNVHKSGNGYEFDSLEETMEYNSQCRSNNDSNGLLGYNSWIHCICASFSLNNTNHQSLSFALKITIKTTNIWALLMQIDASTHFITACD